MGEGVNEWTGAAIDGGTIRQKCGHASEQINRCRDNGWVEKWTDGTTDQHSAGISSGALTLLSRLSLI